MWEWVKNNKDVILVTINFLALVATILIASFSMSTQIKLANENIDFLKRTSPTIKPDITLELYSTSSYSINELSRIEQNVDGDFYPKRNHLNFKFTNLGQKDIDYINFNIKDDGGEYEFENGLRIDNLKKLDDTFKMVDFLSKTCNVAYMETKENNDFEFAWNKCKEVGKNLTKGLRNITLRMDCPSCEFGKRYQCYSFEICVYESDEGFCKDNKGYQILKKTDCPED